jgi:hypothetical protein
VKDFKEICDGQRDVLHLPIFATAALEGLAVQVSVAYVRA